MEISVSFFMLQASSTKSFFCIEALNGDLFPPSAYSLSPKGGEVKSLHFLLQIWDFFCEKNGYNKEIVRYLFDCIRFPIGQIDDVKPIRMRKEEKNFKESIDTKETTMASETIEAFAIPNSYKSLS